MNPIQATKRNIYSLKSKLRGRGSGKACRPLKERNSYRLLRRDIVGNSEVPAESIILLPVGKRGLKVHFICFGLITKKALGATL